VKSCFSVAFRLLLEEKASDKQITAGIPAKKVLK